MLVQELGREVCTIGPDRRVEFWMQLSLPEERGDLSSNNGLDCMEA